MALTEPHLAFAMKSWETIPPVGRWRTCLHGTTYNFSSSAAYLDLPIALLADFLEHQNWRHVLLSLTCSACLPSFWFLYPWKNHRRWGHIKAPLLVIAVSRNTLSRRWCTSDPDASQLQLMNSVVCFQLQIVCDYVFVRILFYIKTRMLHAQSSGKRWRKPPTVYTNNNTQLFCVASSGVHTYPRRGKPICVPYIGINN